MFVPILAFVSQSSRYWKYLTVIEGNSYLISPKNVHCDPSLVLHFEVVLISGSELQIRGGFEDNSKIFFLLNKNMS